MDEDEDGRDAAHDEEPEFDTCEERDDELRTFYAFNPDLKD